MKPEKMLPDPPVAVVVVQKDNICVNVAVLNSQEDATSFKQFADCDDIIPAEDGFGIGDRYGDGIWTKTMPVEPIKEPTTEDYFIDLDFRVSKIELGLEV